MKDLMGIENAKLINIGDEVCDMISDKLERPWFMFKPEEEGVYRLEYSKDTIDTVLVYEKPRFFFQDSRLVDKTRDLADKKWIELFYFEKGKTYFISLLLKPGLKYGTFTFKLLAHEVPANNYRETAYEMELTKVIDGKLDYVTDVDWFKFTPKEDLDYKVIYSRAISDAIHFYIGDTNKTLSPLAEKIYLVNDTVAEPYHFNEGETYYMRIDHIQHRSLGHYLVRFNKISKEMSLLKRYF